MSLIYKLSLNLFRVLDIYEMTILEDLPLILGVFMFACGCGCIVNPIIDFCWRRISAEHPPPNYDTLPGIV